MGVSGKEAVVSPGRWIRVVMGAVILLAGGWMAGAAGAGTGTDTDSDGVPDTSDNCATGESGWLLLGLTGMGALMGVKAFWVVIGEVLGVTLCWLFMAKKFKWLTDRYNSITINLIYTKIIKHRPIKNKITIYKYYIKKF